MRFCVGVAPLCRGRIATWRLGRLIYSCMRYDILWGLRQVAVRSLGALVLLVLMSLAVAAARLRAGVAAGSCCIEKRGT